MQGSQAYAKALGKGGILTADEASTIVDGLGKVRCTSCRACGTVPHRKQGLLLLGEGGGGAQCGANLTNACI